MPSVGTSKCSQSLDSNSRTGWEKENTRMSTGGIEQSPDNLALAAGEMETERSAASDSYMTSTQMAYMSGEKELWVCIVCRMCHTARRRTCTNGLERERYAVQRAHCTNTAPIADSYHRVHMLSCTHEEYATVVVVGGTGQPVGGLSDAQRCCDAFLCVEKRMAVVRTT